MTVVAKLKGENSFSTVESLRPPLIIAGSTVKNTPIRSLWFCRLSDFGGCTGCKDRRSGPRVERSGSS